jgi:hypothetical protein
MFRNLVGFAVFAVVALVALRLIAGLFGFVVGLLGMVLWLAFWGFIFYLILRVLSPSTADKVKETISGKPQS